jgi:hypothetical protein
MNKRCHGTIPPSKNRASWPLSIKLGISVAWEELLPGTRVPRSTMLIDAIKEAIDDYAESAANIATAPTR